MLPLDERIERTERLLRRLEEDEPLLALRLADLGAEHQQSAKFFAAQVMAETRPSCRNWWSGSPATSICSCLHPQT